MRKAFCALFCFILLFCGASAHSGRIDASGGHWDSYTGEYHYHHGYPAHQHTNGICPYEYDDQTGANSGSASTGTTIVNVSDPYENERGDYGPEAEWDFETKRDAHISGFESGIEYSFDRDNPDSAFSKGYDEGYQQGYSDSESVNYDNGHQAGYDEGYDYGYDEGYAQGESDTANSAEEEGYQRGKAEAEQTYTTILIIVIVIAAGLILSRIRIGQKYDELLRKSRALEANFKKFYAEHTEYVQNKNVEVNRLKSALNQKTINNPPQQTPQANKPLPLPKRNVCSFGKWPLSVHQTQPQFTRYQRSKSDDLEILTKSDDGYIIQGTTDVYITTLNSCTCPDFNLNLHEKAPCKHIYFLAQKQGIDVASIFQEYQSNQSRS